jgi:hypothetical protein
VAPILAGYGIADILHRFAIPEKFTAATQDTVLVNVRDTLAFWSGRQLKATKHRVTFDG